MAALQERNGSFRVIFRYHGKQNTFTLGQVSEDEAGDTAATIGNLLRGVEDGRVRVPAGLDIVSFIRHRLATLGRETDDTPEPPPQPRNGTTLGVLRDRYETDHKLNGSIEPNTLDTVRLHFRHFCRVLGEGFPLAELTKAELQDYIHERRQNGLSPVTIRKEIASLRAAWNYGQDMSLTTGQFPSKGLRYPKGKEKPAFMDRREIEQKIARGHKNPSELWECLYLEIHEIGELLSYVKEHATSPFIYPMFCFAAHTGARRSEILRVEISDLDLAQNTVEIHEKKKSRGKDTTRRVPLSSTLKTVLEEWLAVHPGGPYLFCHTHEVARSKKRSRTTGHGRTTMDENGRKVRPTTKEGRKAAVKVREKRPALSQLTKDEAHDHFKRTLENSKWDVLRGWHLLRHSFISALANKGVDQSFIDEWVGHTTEQMRKRYRHLYKSKQQAKLRAVFK